MASISDLRNRIAPAERERGAVLVLTALVMMLLLFIAAFATDLGAWYRQGQEQQRAADVGALNGVQAYDSAVRDYWDELNNAVPAPANDVKRWDQLTLTQAQEAERRGLQAAAQTIIGVLESSGLTFSDVGTGVLAADPRDPALLQTSIWTVVADDGTQIIITRGVVTGTDSNGNTTYTRSIDVQVIAPGEQYFSNIIREAPEITRSASSVLSNCGAVCDSEVTLNPPFAGFGASGNGDGLKPLLKFTTDANNQQQLSEIWAVNHHVKATEGQVICMDAETKLSCKAAQFDLKYQTGTWNEDHLNDNGKLYFAAKNTTTKRTGLACFDTNTYQYCSGSEFVGLFDMPQNAGGAGTININGPIEFGGQLHLVAQNGQMATCNLALTSCSTQNLDSFNSANMPALNVGTRQIGLLQEGAELYIAQYTGSGHILSCVNLSNSNSCMTPRATAGLAAGTNAPPNVFFEYSAGGAINGVCVYQKSSSSTVDCFTTGGANQTVPTGLADFLDNNEGGSYGGQSFTWAKKRIFFATGGSNRVMCWDWSVGGGGQACADLDVLHTPKAYAETHAPTAPKVGDGIEPYGFAQVTEGCLIGLGDSSIFFSFGPEGMGPCVDSTVRTSIQPCDCADGSKRWGPVTLPADLINQVVSINATVTKDKGPNQPAIHVDLENVPLHSTGGVLDLSVLNDLATVPGEVWLELSVSQKLIGGELAWKTEKTFNLEIQVQPTLAS